MTTSAPKQAKPKGHTTPNDTNQLLDRRSVLIVGDGIAAGYASFLLTALGARVSVVVSDESECSRTESHIQCSVIRGHLLAGAVLLPKPPADSILACLEVFAEGVDLAVVDLDWVLALAPAVTIEAIHACLGEAVLVTVSQLGEDIHSGRLGTDFEANAAGGVTSVIGERDRVPLTLPYDLASYQLGLNAVAAGLAGLLAGKGKPVSVDCTTSSILAWYIDMNSVARAHGVPFHRDGKRAAGSIGVYPYGIFPCADGYVTIIARSNAEWHALLSALGSPAWSTAERFRDASRVASDHADEADGLLAESLRLYRRDQLVELAAEHPIALAPVYSPGDVLDEAHFRDAGTFVARRLGASTARLPDVPWRVRLPPRANDDAIPAPPSFKRPADGLPLAGIRVLDLSWVWAGPLVASVLSDLGAEVIKVEHRDRPDKHRLASLIRGQSGRMLRLDGSPFYIDVNRGKQCITLDLTKISARDALLRLLKSSDVLIENMRAGALQGLGLSDDVLRSARPDLLVLSMSSAGRVGRLKDLRAYAPVMSSLAGLDSLVGYPGEPAVGMMNVGLGDPNAALHGLVVLLAALDHRSVTGKGANIELSQVDALLSTLPEPLLEYQRSGREPAVRGNDAPNICPRGVYPAAGEDEWVAISVTDDAVWRRLVQLMAITSRYRTATSDATIDRLLTDRSLNDLAGRRLREREIAEAIAEWSVAFERDHLALLLADARVPCAPVLSPFELDRHGPYALQGRTRDTIVQPGLGEQAVHRLPWRIAGFKTRTPAPAPLFGQHTSQILNELGYSSEDIVRLIMEGALR